MTDATFTEHSSATIAGVFAASRGARAALLFHATAEDLSAAKGAAASFVCGACFASIDAHDFHLAGTFNAATTLTAFAIDDAVLVHLLASACALFAEHPPRTLQGGFAGFASAICAASVKGGGLTEAGITAAITLHALISETCAASGAEEEVTAQVAFAGEARPATELPLHAALEPDHVDDGLDPDTHICQERLANGAECADFTWAAGLSIAATFGAG